MWQVAINFSRLMSLFKMIKKTLSSSGKGGEAIKIERKRGEFGDFYSYPDKNYWSKEVVRNSGEKFTISGQGGEPSKEQVHTLRHIESHIESLIKSALEVIEEPTNLPRAPRIQIQYDSCDLELRDVFIEGEKSYSFYFDTRYGDAIDNWPIVEFVDDSIKEAYWSS